MSRQAPPPEPEEQQQKRMASTTKQEASHYVVTAHPPGAVLLSKACNFTDPDSTDVLVAKSRRLEIRQTGDGGGALPILCQIPVYGRLVGLEAFRIPSIPTSLVFVLNDRMEYAAISYNSSLRAGGGGQPVPVANATTSNNNTATCLTTHAHGCLNQDQCMASLAETGPLVTMDPYSRCIVLHWYDGLLTVIPIHTSYEPRTAALKGESQPMTSTPPKVLGKPYHCRVEERKILALQFLHTQTDTAMPILAVLCQDGRNAQHLTTHVVNLKLQQLHLYASPSAPPTTEWIKKSNVDGGSSLLLAVPPRTAASAAAASSTSAHRTMSATAQASTGGVIILGQRQITYLSATTTKILPVTQALFLATEQLPLDENGMPRFLLADEFGNLHLLSVTILQNKVVGLQMETLGSCNLANSLSYIAQGLLFVGSSLGDSQLVQIHDEPIPLEDVEDAELADTSYLSVLEEYTNLGPILDFDLLPTGAVGQSQMITASGTSKSGTLRLIRNGIGMEEYAAVEVPGIQNMWNLRKSYADKEDTYLVQSFVQETRVLGVVSTSMEEHEEPEASLEEVELPGLDQTKPTLYVGNVESGDRLLQITEDFVRLSSISGELLDTVEGSITVGTANEAGQIAIARGGAVLSYYMIENDKIVLQKESKLENEISCLDLNPFSSHSHMELDEDHRGPAEESDLVAVGQWGDFSVRVLSLVDLVEVMRVDLDEGDKTDDDVGPLHPGSSRQFHSDMTARSLCLVTLDLSSQGKASSNQSVNMLLMGAGDGTLVSCAIMNRQGKWFAESKKEVRLGTQRISLLPLYSKLGGTCVLATGDRPTVIYLAGIGGSSSTQINPKLCYSNVSVSTSEYDETGDISRPPSHHSLSMNVAATFFSPSLFGTGGQENQNFSLCVADSTDLRLGVIDDIQKLHVTTCKLGMAPRRVVHCVDGRLFAVACIESGINHLSLGDDEGNMGNCIRFMDDATFDDIDRKDLEPFEMAMCMGYVSLSMPAEMGSDQKPKCKSFLAVGTAYGLPDEEEPSRGRILLYSFHNEHEGGQNSGRAVRLISEFNINGGVYSIAQFYNGMALCTVGSKTLLVRLVDLSGILQLEFVGNGHHGHILSLFVESMAPRTTDELVSDETDTAEKAIGMDTGEPEDRKPKSAEKEQLALVGDIARSVGLVQYYPQHQTLEEVARDFNGAWTTAGAMLTEDVYIVGDHWNNFFCVRRNRAATSEEIRCRLDTIGEFHVGEMTNKFMRGSLTMPVTASLDHSHSRGENLSSRMSPKKKRRADVTSPSKKSSAIFRPQVVTGSQTLFGTVEGSVGVVLGLDFKTAAFFSCLERSMALEVESLGGFSHQLFRSFQSDRRGHPAMGFVDGDLVESFVDLDRSCMERVVNRMNRDGEWHAMEDVKAGESEGNEEKMEEDCTDHADLTVDDVLSMVEEISLLH